MKVFISWSGTRSKAVGELLNEWLKCVLQALEPWMSSKDIDRGSLWFSEINDQLKDTGVGIVCITSSNMNKPWILFEAGALAKGLSSNRVCTFLVDLTPTDIGDPLAQFNHTRPVEDDVWMLVRTLNKHLGNSMLPERILENVFKTYWPQFESSFADIIANTTDDVVPVKRDENDILSEILNMTRALDKRVRNMESNPREKYLKSEMNRIKHASNNALTVGEVFKAQLLEELRNADINKMTKKKILEKYANIIPENEIHDIVDYELEFKVME